MGRGRERPKCVSGAGVARTAGYRRGGERGPFLSCARPCKAPGAPAPDTGPQPETLASPSKRRGVVPASTSPVLSPKHPSPKGDQFSSEILSAIIRGQRRGRTRVEDGRGGPLLRRRLITLRSLSRPLLPLAHPTPAPPVARSTARPLAPGVPLR